MQVSTDYCAIPGPYGYKWPTLSELHFSLFEIGFEKAHNAGVDVAITAKCFWELIDINYIYVESLKKGTELKNDRGLKSEFLIPYRKGGKWGFCNKDKKILIDCVYDQVRMFSDGLAAVRKDGKYGYIDMAGNLAIGIRYGNTTYYPSDMDFVDGTALVYNNELVRENEIIGAFEIIDKTGNVLLTPSKDTCICTVPKEGFVAIDKYVGFRKRNTELLHVEGKYCIKGNFERAHAFSEARALVQVDKKVGYIDYQGIQVIPCIYDDGSDFTDGISIVRKDGKQGCIDKDGNILLHFIYDELKPFTESLAAFKTQGKWGFVDSSGKVIISAIFEDAQPFSNGLAGVKVDNRWRFINQKGEYIGGDYYYISDYSEGLATVVVDGKIGGYEDDLFIDGKYGYIDRKGEVRIPFIFDSADDFKDGIALVSCHGKWGGYIDFHGTQFWED